MVKETSARAIWNHVLEKGLLDILVEHNVPIYRCQNGWAAERWRSITSKFKEKFPREECPWNEAHGDVSNVAKAEVLAAARVNGHVSSCRCKVFSDFMLIKYLIL